MQIAMVDVGRMSANMVRRLLVQGHECVVCGRQAPTVASFVGSWLLDLSAQALQKAPELAAYGVHVSDSGEGRWTIQAAIDEAVPAHVLSAALFDHFSSRGSADFATRILFEKRHEFSGHTEKPGL